MNEIRTDDDFVFEGCNVIDGALAFTINVPGSDHMQSATMFYSEETCGVSHASGYISMNNCELMHDKAKSMLEEQLPPPNG